MTQGKDKQPLLVTTSNGPEFTREVGANFAEKLVAGDVVCFYGNLGSGKTTFIQGLCSRLQVRETVNSPTFTLINEYHGTLPVYHFDFYRVNDARELIELGTSDYLHGEGICLIEWPDIVQELLPATWYRVTLEHDMETMDETRRHIRINSEGNNHS